MVPISCETGILGWSPLLFISGPSQVKHLKCIEIMGHDSFDTRIMNYEVQAYTY
ncbi:MAG: hypothetical protein ACLU30_19235 [Odoribacter splanchnicus]